MSTTKETKTLGIGARLKNYRKSRGLTLVQMAELCGISHGSLSSLENEKTKPSADTLAFLCLHTDIDLKWVLTGTESKNWSTNIPNSPFLKKVGEWLEEISRGEPFRKDWFEGQFRDSFPKFVRWEKGKELSECSENEFTSSKVA